MWKVFADVSQAYSIGLLMRDGKLSVNNPYISLGRGRSGDATAAKQGPQP